MNEDTYWHHRRFSFANVHNYSNRYKANELFVNASCNKPNGA